MKAKTPARAAMNPLEFGLTAGPGWATIGGPRREARMLFASEHIRVTAEYRTATLAFAFPGRPVNALDLARLWELDAAVAAVERNPFVDILVVRSANPVGFCGGLSPAAVASLPTAADRAAFAAYGQRVLARLAALDAATVAFVDGPCLGVGLELALACDHRLVLSRPDTLLGFPDGPPCFGGTARLGSLLGRRAADRLIDSGDTLSGREARRLGLVDHAFCDRRAKIELRSFLDRLEVRGWRPRRRPVHKADNAAERRTFAEAPPVSRAVPIPPVTAVLGLVGDNPSAGRRAAGVALRGGRVLVCGSGTAVLAGIAEALARGFVTPLEADQARGRVTVGDDLTGFDRAERVLTAGDRWAEVARVVRPLCAVEVYGQPPPPHPLPATERGDRTTHPGGGSPPRRGEVAGGRGLRSAA